MAKINCLNPIAACGMDLFNDTYEVVDDFAAADAVLVRSAAMHDLELSEICLQSHVPVRVSTTSHLTSVQRKES